MFNRISDIAPLAGLTQLGDLSIQNNYIEFTPGSVGIGIIQSLQSSGAAVAYLPQNLPPGAVSVSGGAGDTSVTLQKYYDMLQIFQDNVFYSAALSTTTSLTINDGPGDDNLTIDLSGGSPIPSGGLFFNGGGGNDTINVGNAGGRHGVPLVSGGLTVTGRNVTIISHANGLSVTASNDAAVTFATSQHLAALTILDNAKVMVAADGNHFIRTPTLSLAPTASLDLNDNDLILQSSAAKRLTDLAALTILRQFGISDQITVPWTS